MDLVSASINDNKISWYKNAYVRGPARLPLGGGGGIEREGQRLAVDGRPTQPARTLVVRACATLHRYGTAAWNSTGLLFPNGSEVIISTTSPSAYVRSGGEGLVVPAWRLHWGGWETLAASVTMAHHAVKNGCTAPHVGCVPAGTKWRSAIWMQTASWTQLQCASPRDHW
jgi:hypothetical protein